MKFTKQQIDGARELMREYDAAMLRGEEPEFPQEAADIIAACKCWCGGDPTVCAYCGTAVCE